jgi:hypothetical protein
VGHSKSSTNVTIIDIGSVAVGRLPAIRRFFINLSMTVSPVKNSKDKIIGASKIARDITERKRSEALIVNLAREAEHGAKNILAAVQATVHLSHSDTSDDLKTLIEGRIMRSQRSIRCSWNRSWTAAQLRHARAFT